MTAPIGLLARLPVGLPPQPLDDLLPLNDAGRLQHADNLSPEYVAAKGVIS